MAELIPIGDTEKRQNRLIDVIFVHGYGGKPIESWAPKKDQENVSMLHWLAKDSKMSNIGVWSLKHESSQIRRRNRPSLTRAELANNLLIDFSSKFKIFPNDFPSHQILWVCHSEGGNIVKQLLRLCIEARQSNPTAESILRAFSDIFFIDTPHQGSLVASLVHRLRIFSPRMRELREGDEGLLELHHWYLNYVNSIKSISNFSIIQSNNKFRVVGKASAYLGIGKKYFIDKDHNKIAQPNSADEEPFPVIRSRITFRLEELEELERMQPVASKLYRVKNNQTVNIKSDKRIWRLLIVTRSHNGSYKPVNSGDIKLDLAIMLRLPDGSEYYPNGSKYDPNRCSNNEQELEWKYENLTPDLLAERIIEIYPCYDVAMLGKDPDDGNSILLVNLFLPIDLFGNPYIPLLLSKIREKLAMNPVSPAGLPLIFSCSSRYRLSNHEIPTELIYSKSELLKKSQKIVGILSATETPFSRLNWILIHDNLSQSVRVDDDSGNSVFPSVLSQKLSGVDFDDICNFVQQENNLEIDPLQESHCAFLSFKSNTSSESLGRHRLRIQHLLKIGVPLMWIQDAMTVCGQSTGTSAEAASLKEAAEYADTMLGWAHGEFHDRFHRYNHKSLATGQKDEVGIRRYIRNGILFWEDHRFLPPEILPFRGSPLWPSPPPSSPPSPIPSASSSP
jgi:hypothetical protein